MVLGPRVRRRRLRQQLFEPALRAREGAGAGVGRSRRAALERKSTAEGGGAAARRRSGPGGGKGRRRRRTRVTLLGSFRIAASTWAKQRRFLVSYSGSAAATLRIPAGGGRRGGGGGGVRTSTWNTLTTVGRLSAAGTEAPPQRAGAAPPEQRRAPLAALVFTVRAAWASSQFWAGAGWWAIRARAASSLPLFLGGGSARPNSPHHAIRGSRSKRAPLPSSRALPGSRSSDAAEGEVGLGFGHFPSGGGTRPRDPLTAAEGSRAAFSCGGAFPSAAQENRRGWVGFSLVTTAHTKACGRGGVCLRRLRVALLPATTLLLRERAAALMLPCPASLAPA